VRLVARNPGEAIAGGGDEWGAKIRLRGETQTPSQILHLLFQGMVKSQQRWKALRGLSSLSCCAMAVWLPLNSAKTMTNSSAPLSQ
jgi:hypothetical protein